MKLQRLWAWKGFYNGNRVNYPAVNAKELRLDVPSSVTRKYSSWMNRCQTWMQN